MLLLMLYILLIEYLAMLFQIKLHYELLHDKPPTYLNLKVFCCVAYVSTLEFSIAKLHPRAKKCVSLGLKLVRRAMFFLTLTLC